MLPSGMLMSRMLPSRMRLGCMRMELMVFGCVLLLLRHLLPPSAVLVRYGSPAWATAD